jgi:hypothetical protein
MIDTKITSFPPEPLVLSTYQDLKLKQVRFHVVQLKSWMEEPRIVKNGSLITQKVWGSDIKKVVQ